MCQRKKGDQTGHGPKTESLNHLLHSLLSQHAHYVIKGWLNQPCPVVPLRLGKRRWLYTQQLNHDRVYCEYLMQLPESTQPVYDAVDGSNLLTLGVPPFFQPNSRYLHNQSQLCLLSHVAPSCAELRHNEPNLPVSASSLPVGRRARGDKTPLYNQQ